MKNEPIKMTENLHQEIDKVTSIIERLKLKPHPEGGWYREVYRSGELLMTDFSGISTYLVILQLKLTRKFVTYY